MPPISTDAKDTLKAIFQYIPAARQKAAIEGLQGGLTDKSQAATDAQLQAQYTEDAAALGHFSDCHFTNSRPVAECFDELTTGTGSISSSSTTVTLPPLPPGTIDQVKHKRNGGIEVLRRYAYNKDRRKNIKDLPTKLGEELALFEGYYQQLLPHVPHKQRDDFTAEYEALRDLEFSKRRPKIVYIDAAEIMFAGGFNAVTGPFMTDFTPPIWSYYGFRFWANQPRREPTPYEQTKIASFRSVADLTLFTAGLISSKKPPTSDEPQDTEYTFGLGGANSALNNDTIRFYLNNSGDFLLADAFAGLALRRLDDVTVPYLGPKASLIVDPAFDSVKLMFVSSTRARYQFSIDQTKVLTHGEDGDECSGESAGEIELFCLNNPEVCEELSQQYSGLELDQKIMDLICSSTDTGSNEAFPAPKRVFDLATRGRYISAYATIALHRNYRLFSDGSTEALITGAALAGLQPLLNQIPNIGRGFNGRQLGTDYLLEGLAAGETVLSLDKPEVLYSFGLANDQIGGAFTNPSLL